MALMLALGLSCAFLLIDVVLLGLGEYLSRVAVLPQQLTCDISVRMSACVNADLCWYLQAFVQGLPLAEETRAKMMCEIRNLQEFAAQQPLSPEEHQLLVQKTRPTRQKMHTYYGPGLH